MILILTGVILSGRLCIGIATGQGGKAIKINVNPTYVRDQIPLPVEIHNVLLVKLLKVEGREVFRRHGILVSVP